MIELFAEAWGRLIERKQIKRIKNGVPTLYVVAIPQQ
jgi:hypothetical protein